jgi:hypothetical protein
MTSGGNLEERPILIPERYSYKGNFGSILEAVFPGTCKCATRTISDTEPCYVKKSHIQGNCERGP